MMEKKVAAAILAAAVFSKTATTAQDESSYRTSLEATYEWALKTVSKTK
jgi:hypothetical protein